MRKIVSLFVVLTLILSSCGSATTTSTGSGSSLSGTTDKTPFLITTTIVGSGSSSTDIRKIGRIVSSSTLTLTAQGVGEIAKINVREGQSVRAGTVIASLKDTLNNYDLILAQAQNTLKIQDATIATTKINLDQSVDNARIAQERAEQAYNTLVGKNSLQYDTVVNTNNKTLKTYNETFGYYLTDLEKITTQLLYEGDKILNSSGNNGYQAWIPYLGAKNGVGSNPSVSAWNTLYGLHGEIEARILKGLKINTQDPNADLTFISSGYAQSRTYVDTLLNMIQNDSLGGILTQQVQDGWITLWNGYRTSVGTAESAFNNWKASSITFFDGYKNTEIATKLAIASQSRPLTADELAIISSNEDIRITYETNKLTLADSIKTAKLNLDQANLTYTNAQELRQATITQLGATRNNAQIALDQATRNYAKLQVTAPVDGIITKIYADVGQAVTMGTSIADFSGKQPEVQLDIPVSLADTLTVGQHVGLTVDDGTTLDGTIIAVSKIASANLLATVRIGVKNGTQYIGQTTTISFIGNASVSDNGTLSLPLDAVRIISEDEGEVAIYSGGTIERMPVQLGAPSDTNIEIKTAFALGTAVITSNTTNFDPLKNTIVQQ